MASRFYRLHLITITLDITVTFSQSIDRLCTFPIHSFARLFFIVWRTYNTLYWRQFAFLAIRTTLWSKQIVITVTHNTWLNNRSQQTTKINFLWGRYLLGPLSVDGVWSNDTDKLLVTWHFTYLKSHWYQCCPTLYVINSSWVGERAQEAFKSKALMIVVALSLRRRLSSFTLHSISSHSLISRALESGFTGEHAPTNGGSGGGVDTVLRKCTSESVRPSRKQHVPWFLRQRKQLTVVIRLFV